MADDNLESMGVTDRWHRVASDIERKLDIQ